MSRGLGWYKGDLPTRIQCVHKDGSHICYVISKELIMLVKCFEMHLILMGKSSGKLHGSAGDT
jgi:hypothetical protein